MKSKKGVVTLEKPIFNIASVMRSERAATGKSQREVATELNMSQQRYSKYEIGAGMPKLERLVKIADLYDVSLDYLCGRTKTRTLIKKDVDSTTESMLS